MNTPRTGGVEIHREGEINYSKPLARALLRDARLSFGARGLFAFLWDLPAGWRTNSTHLSTMSPKGRGAVRALLRELELVGALRYEAIREGGRLAGRRCILLAPDRWAVESSLSADKTPKPAPEANSTEGPVSRPSRNPTVGKSHTKVLQCSKVFRKEAAAPRARGKEKIYNRRDSGIITWLPADVQAAEKIELESTPEEISAAISSLKRDVKQPVPGHVAQKIEQLKHQRVAAARRAQNDARVKQEIDPLARAKGEQILSRLRKIKNATTSDA